MFDEINFKATKLPLTHIKFASERFEKLIKAGFSKELSLACLMAERGFIFTLTDSIEVTDNSLPIETYFSLPKLVEDFNKSNMKSEIQDYLKGLDFDEALKEDESHRVAKELQRKKEEAFKIELSLRQERISKAAEDREKEVAKKALSESLIKSKTADKGYEVKIRGASAKIPNGYVQALLSFDEINKARSIFNEARSRVETKSKSLYKVMKEFKNILIPLDVSFICSELDNSDIYGARSMIERVSEKDRIINNGLIALNHAPLEGEMLEKVKEFYEKSTPASKRNNSFLKVMEEFDLIISQEDALNISNSSNGYLSKIDEDKLIIAQTAFLKSKGAYISTKGVYNASGARSIDIEGYKRRSLSESELCAARELYLKLREKESKLNSVQEVFKKFKVNLVASDVRKISDEIKPGDVSTARRKLSEL